MKKLVLIVALLIAISSCSTEDDMVPKNITVAISTNNEFMASTTNKNVQRGSMYAWISEMQIKATHESGYVTITDFTLVNNGTPGSDTKFMMDNVQLGKNTFTASSKTKEPERLETTQFSRPNGGTSPTNTVIINQFNTLNSRNPYAIYTSVNPVTSTIVEGIAQGVNIPLKTDNSRIIAVFATDDVKGSNTDNVVTITCYVNGASFGPPATCNGTLNAAYYWSDRNSIAGKSISFRIVNNDRGTLDIYNTPAIVIKASNTLKMLYIIKDKKLIISPM
jgi:hypothetical protein